jgi:hypothetical protein
VGLRVVDKHGTTHNHVHSETVIVRPFDNQPPVASFVHIPDVPLLGQQVSFHSTATDADSAIAVSFVSTTLTVGEGSVGSILGGGLRELFPFA